MVGKIDRALKKSKMEVPTLHKNNNNDYHWCQHHHRYFIHIISINLHNTLMVATVTIPILQMREMWHREVK